MSGFLRRLDKRETRTNPVANDLLVRSSNANGADTGVVTAAESIGAADALLAELRAEGQNLKSRAKGGSDPRHSSSKIKIIQSETKDNKDKVPLKRDTKIFDESLPWWLTDPAPCSPHVDLLVPAARLVLNELISDNISPEELAQAVRRAVNAAAEQLSHEVRFSGKDLNDSVTELTSLMMGKGPLQPLYDDPWVTDIYLDGHKSIKCVRKGQALETPFKFRSPTEYEAYITSMLQSIDRVLNMSSPIVDCVLSDKWRSRINAVHSSLLDGDESSLVIRVPRLQQISFYDLLRTKTLPATVAAWLAELVSCGHANIMVMGPTGSGKTTLTTALLSAVGSDERICTIEDVPEIFVPTTHLEKLVSRPENSQGEGAVGMDRLLRAALRRAPHRIVVGEIRDREGPLFLKALETGHAGSVATIHADNPRDGLWRLLDVVAAFEDAPQESIQRRIARSLHILISMKRVNGKPCLTEIAEVRQPVGGEFVVKSIIRFEGEVAGKRQWRILTHESEWITLLADRGMELQPGPGLLAMERAGAHDSSRSLQN